MFCPEHKKMMKPVPGKGLVCPVPGCGEKMKASEGVVVKTKSVDDDKKSIMVDATQKMDLLPTTEEYACEKCGNSKAYYFMRQTRSADEATTRFLECTKCGYKWREYR